MRLSCVLAVVTALLSAAAADACCIFKCFHRWAAPAQPAAPVVRRTATGGDPFDLYMKVTYVGGKKVEESSGTVPEEVDPRPYVEVIVETDAWTGDHCDVKLSISGSPRAPAAPAKAAAPAKEPRVVFIQKRVKQPKPVSAVGAVAAAPTAGTATAYEFIFHVYDLEYLYEYKVFSYSDWCTERSPTVTFKTKAGTGSPPSPPGAR